MVALLFPGQGSQFVGMGADLADAYPAARHAFEEADDALGTALSRVMWEGPEEELTATLNAQPAILAHSVAAYRVLEPAIGEVSFAAGHSLGEFSAHVAAGTIGFADALRLVRRRGEAMYDAGLERPGTMAAVIGLDDEAVAAVCAEVGATWGVVVAANYNAPGQVVISGEVGAVDAAREALTDAGARRALPLNVSGAFHSPLMEPAAAVLEAALEEVAFADPAFPVISNVTAQPVAESAAAKRLLVEQLTSPVRWVAGIQTLRSAGVGRFLEIGPGNVLTGLLRRIDRDAEGSALGTAAAAREALASASA
ncbi:MAG TPA: ACP S-malonyltransferase [Longimicrobiales bacterium]|nr:ACP S-malonyltransferase [Longimicrobiales bacterium]